MTTRSNSLAFVFFCILTFLLCGPAQSAPQESLPNFASGIKVGEVTQTTAIVWVRLTKNKQADFGRLPILTEGLEAGKRSQVEMPIDIVAGTPGKVRLHYSQTGTANRQVSAWHPVGESNDFIHQFRVSSLQPGADYEFTVEAIGMKTDAPENREPLLESARISGSFRTAPAIDDRQKIRFIVSTCQAVRSIDSGARGHKTYHWMKKFDPDFFVHTGDIVYYDKVPLCKSPAAARAKWSLMFSYAYNREFHRNVAAYFMKDDHDTLKNDCWPGQTYGALTFEQGLKIFRQQVCMGDQTYRTVRWGKDVQIWMTENRDFRSPNRMPDGPGKTILGERQKAWLKKTMKDSNATFKFLISPGPLVGPDKRGKNDNHSNKGFATEGGELRQFLAKQKNTFVICGDRHWQYSSKDPETGLLEFGCGPVNDQHSFGGNPGNHPEMHRYFSARGGFLGVTVDADDCRVEWFQTNQLDSTGQPVVGHTETLRNN